MINTPHKLVPDIPGSITDTFGRVHDYLRISLTERCNLRCFYCMPEEGITLRPRSHFMQRDEIISITKSFISLGVKKIRLTGGEPLVRNDARAIISGLSQLNTELAITTNGILVDRFIETFKRSGITSVNVSLDSLDSTKYNTITRRNYFEKVMSNISLLIKNNFHVKLNAVIMRGVNDNEIFDFIEYTRTNHVHFRFIEFMPFAGNNWHRDKGVSYNEMMSNVYLLYGEKVEKLEDGKNDTSKNYKINGYAGSFALISSVTNPFCDSCNRIRLTADGKIKNCLFSNNETDLLFNLRQGNDIRPLILESVLNKKARRGGMNTQVQIQDPAIHANNRSMTAIGG